MHSVFLLVHIFFFPFSSFFLHLAVLFLRFCAARDFHDGVVFYEGYV